MTTKIMIVDDEPAIGRLLQYQLQGFGYQVSYEPDGMLALQHLGREWPDLILLDVMLPGMSGWDICRQIRACSAVPIIMLTAKNADSDVVAGLSAGADDYISKPFRMAEVRARIEAVLRRTSLASPPRYANGASVRASAYPAQRGDTPPRIQALAPTPTAPASPAAPPATGQAPAPAYDTAPTLKAQDSAGLTTASTPLRLGPQLREVRLARGLSLNQVEATCNIRWEFLQAIEQENFSYVPRAQLRRSLRIYADYLGVNLHELLGHPPPQPRHIPESLSYVMIIALVILLAYGLHLLNLI